MIIKSFKLFLLIFVIVGIILFLVQKFVPQMVARSAKKDTQQRIAINTSSWKLFNNYGISFKYPSEWTSIDEGELGNLVNVYISADGTQSSIVFVMAGSRGCSQRTSATVSQMIISGKTWTRIDEPNQTEICRNSDTPGGGYFVDLGYNSSSTRSISEAILSTLKTTY